MPNRILPPRLSLPQPFTGCRGSTLASQPQVIWATVHPTALGTWPGSCECLRRKEWGRMLESSPAATFGGDGGVSRCALTSQQIGSAGQAALHRIRKISIWSHRRSLQPPTQDIVISVLRCRRPIHSEKIGAAGPRWPDSNRNHYRDETRSGWVVLLEALSRSRNPAVPKALQRPRIVGEMANPVFEAVRRLWWRAFDRICSCVMLIRL